MTRRGTRDRGALQTVFEESQAVPLDESHDQVDTVGTRQLGPDLVTQPRFSRSVRQKCGLGQRGRRALSQRSRLASRRGRQGIARSCLAVARESSAAPRISTSWLTRASRRSAFLSSRKSAEGDIPDVPRQDVWLVGLVDRSALNVQPVTPPGASRARA